MHARRRRPDHRLPRPVRRAAQGPAGAARGHAHRRPPASRRRGCWSPAAATPTRCAELVGADLRAARRAPRRAVARRTRPRSCARSTSTARPTCGESPSASCSSRRWPPGAPIVASDLDAFAPGAGRRRRRRAVPPRRRRPPWPRRLCELLGRPGPAGRARRRGGARAAAAYDWDVAGPAGSSPSTRPSLPPGGGEVTAADDDQPYPSVPPRASGGALGPAPAGGALASTPVTSGVWLLLVGVLVLLLLAWTVWTLVRLQPAARPASPAPGRRSTPSCSGGPGWPRSWPATIRPPSARTAARYLAAFAADARAPDGRRPGARREPARARAAATLPEDLAGIPTAAADRPRRHRHPGRAGPPVPQRRGPRHRGAARAAGCPGCCGCTRSRPLPRYFDIDDRLDRRRPAAPTAPVRTGR